MKKFFDTEKKRKEAIEDLKNLLLNPGWGLLVEITRKNIEVLTERIISNPKDDNKEKLDQWRKKIEAYRDVIQGPEKMVERLQGGAKYEKEVNYDPYYTKEDFETVEEKSKKTNA